MLSFFKKEKNYETMPIDVFHNKLSKEKLSIIDVRNPAEFNSGHIPTAVNVPMDDIPNFSGDKNTTYYIICQSGMRTKMAANTLSKKNYKVIAVENGMNNWPGKVTNK